MPKLIASETSRNDRWIPTIVVLLHRHDLDGISALVVPIQQLTQHQFRGHESLAMKYVKHSQEMLRPAQHLPIQQQMRSAVQCVGTAGGVKWAKPPYTASKVAKSVQIWSLRRATNILGAPSSTTTPNTIHLSALHHSIQISAGPGWK